MRTCAYLDRVRTKLNLSSDNALAKALGISRQAISNYRAERGSLDDDVAQRVAAILEIHPGIVLIDMYTERTKNAETKSLWEEIQAGFHVPSRHANSGNRGTPARL
jgi:transcriptional regulator with XRE-family HTH domain